MAHKYKCYGQDCVKGSDCDDANSAVYPGSCSSGAVTWTTCGTLTTGGCGSGTCTRSLPSECVDVCGDGSKTGSEGCDAGVNNGRAWQFSSWVDCGDYSDVQKHYRCSSSCQFEYRQDSCQSCGDGECNGPETKATCVADCGKCGDGKVTGDEGCDWVIKKLN